MNTRSLIKSLLILVGALIAFPSLSRAQSVPQLPCCIDFNNPDQGGISGSFVNDLDIRYPGPSGDPNDGYLHARDASGGSWARLKNPNDGKPHCFGNWKELLRPGKCIDLCWDVNLLTDGDNSQVIMKPAHITIWFGGLRAVFRTFNSISEMGGPNNGWYSFCAPIALSNPDGTLPSNDQGEWIFKDANGNDRPAAEWDQLLCNIDQIAFAVDYHGFQTEEWCWDNICLTERDCAGCVVSNGSWDCEIDAAGGRTLKYTFDVTNNSATAANVGLATDLPGIDIEPNTWDFVPDLLPGETQTVTLCIDGAKAGTEICFDFVLFNLKEGECCRTEICTKVPCVKITEEQIECPPGAIGTSYQFTLTNISGAAAQYAYLLPKDPGVTFSPALINLGSLADGASMPIGPISIQGAPPLEELCFCVVLLDEQLRECCITEHCVNMPDCPVQPVVPLKNGLQTKPCEPDPTNPDQMIVTSPDGCFSLCDENIICDPLNPGCYTYSFTVTNHSSSIMDHILFPDPHITPSQVVFSDPLDPGEAAHVTVKITGAQPGSFVLPMVLVSLDDCFCCSFHHTLVLEECDCTIVLKEKLECEGRDPATGLLCYNYCVTIQNVTGDTVEHVYLIPQSGSGVTFNPSHFPGTLPHLGTVTIVSTVKIPDSAKHIHFHISLHNEQFEECCSTERWLEVPECCDCEETVTFEFDPANPGGELPEGVTLINLQQNPNTGKVGFGADISTFPFVYMAASGRGTAVRIDSVTGAVLGEYRTAPQTAGFLNPSRTTVDKFGECWVGNRGGAVSGQGSVMRIGVILGGTRGDRLGVGPYTFVANPAGEYLQGPFSYLSPSVIDRDGDGFIRTSAGLANILDWDPTLTSGNDLGGVSLSDDECVVNFVRIPSTDARALAIDSNNDLWAGGLSSSLYQRIDGGTGIPNITRTVPGGYGCLIDGNDVLWSVANGSGLYRHDIPANDVPSFHPAASAYGVGINPCDGSIWVSSRGTSSEPAFGVISQNVLRQFDSAGTLIGACAQPGFAQGLCVDQNGDVWVAGGGDVWRFDSACNLIGTVSAGISGTTGCAVDQNGDIWASDQVSHSAVRINPVTLATTPTSLGFGASPYNYSDMTGFVTLGAAGQTGIMLFTHDSLCPGTDWGRVTWKSIGEIADECGITAEVRASDDPLNYPATWTLVGNGISFCGGPQGTAPIAGQYIQIRLIFNRPSACPPICNPELCWLKVECCDVFGIGPANDPPVVEINDPIALPNTPAPTPITVSANVIDLNGGRLQATWSVGGQSVASETFDDEGNPELTFDFPNGITEVSLSVSDGQNTTTASTSVMIGDHMAPVVHCDSPEFEGGELSVSAFRATVPDLLPFVVATDNVTPSSQLALMQSPARGTVVGQGIHPITITAGDAAGNLGKCTVFLIVKAVANVSSFSNYASFEQGAPAPLALSYGVDSDEIARTEIIIDGEVFRIINGPLLEPIDLNLPVGAHEVHAIVTDAAGNTSTSSRRVFGVIDPNPDPFAPQQDITARWETPDRETLIFTFGTPDGFECLLQLNSDLADEWQTIHTVEGTGGRVDFAYPVPDNFGDLRAYFRVLYRD
ncbi:MAG: hypothetical protein ACI8XO_001048 [Verrucomicrobiales bacterium]|jgi:hypothetical protein